MTRHISAVMLVVVLFASACADHSIVASGELAAAPTPTPEPNPAPTATPTPAPDPVIEAEGALAEVGRAGRGQRQFALTPALTADGLARPRSADDPDAQQWPESLEPFALAIERHAGPFEFEAPEIRFVTELQMSEHLRRDLPDLAVLPANVVEAIERYDDVHRALGIATVEFDVLGSNSDSARAVTGLYNSGSHAILIRAQPTENDLVERAILIHEIAHSWQGPDRILGYASSARSQITVGALIEGEAERITYDWLEELEPETQLSYLERLDEAEAEAITLGVSQAASLQADVRVRYTLGRRLHDTARAAEIEGFNGVSGRDLLDPIGWSEDGPATLQLLTAPSVDAPTLRNVWVPIDSVILLQMFGGTSEPVDALLAARSTTSMSEPTWWVNEADATCISFALMATEDGAPIVEQAIENWQAGLAELRTVTQVETAATSAEEPNYATAGTPATEPAEPNYATAGTPGSTEDGSDGETSETSESAGTSQSAETSETGEGDRDESADESAPDPTITSWRLDACDPGAGEVPEPITDAATIVEIAALMIDGEAFALANDESAEVGRCRAANAIASDGIEFDALRSMITAALESASPDCS